jgi:hypothetical protein
MIWKALKYTFWTVKPQSIYIEECVECMDEKRRIVQYPREKEDTSTHYPIVSNGF